MVVDVCNVLLSALFESNTFSKWCRCACIAKLIHLSVSPQLSGFHFLCLSLSYFHALSIITSILSHSHSVSFSSSIFFHLLFNKLCSVELTLRAFRFYVKK